MNESQAFTAAETRGDNTIGLTMMSMSASKKKPDRGSKSVARIPMLNRGNDKLTSQMRVSASPWQWTSKMQFSSSGNKERSVYMNKELLTDSILARKA